MINVSSHVFHLTHHDINYQCSGARLLGVLIPTTTLLLRPSQTPPSTVHSSGITHLLSLAASSPASFKEATTQLDPSVREVLEMSIRKAVGGIAGTTAHQSVKPQISLRSF